MKRQPHLPFKVSKAGNLSINTLFIQPTNWCRKKCKGCYVKERFKESDIPNILSLFDNIEEFSSLLNQFVRGPHHANQLVVSIDELPSSKNQRSKMIKGFDTIIKLCKETYKTRNTEIGIAINSFTSLHQYMYHSKYQYEDLLKLDILTVSDVWPHNIVALPNVTTVWNYLARPGDRINKYRFEYLSSFFQYIYIILYKAPISNISRDNPEQFAINSIKWYLHHIIPSIMQLPINIRKKIILDTCLTDNIFSIKEDSCHGCPSNVSRFQVWPNGSVSGCMYSKDRDTPEAVSSSKIIENMRTTARHYDFKDKCYIAKALEEEKINEFIYQG